MKFKQKFLVILSVFLMFFSLVTPALAHGSEGISRVAKPESKLNKRLYEQFDVSENVTFIIKFKEKANTTDVAHKAQREAERASLSSYQTKLKVRSAVVSELKTVSEQSQRSVIKFLDEELAKGNVEEVRPYYIVNGIAVTGTIEVAERIAEFSEVEKVLPNEKRQLIEAEPVSEKNVPTSVEEVEWNVERSKAPDVWEMGVDGNGIVVATIDSGVQWDHPALKEKYRGYSLDTGEVDHSYSWFDATDVDEQEPYDDNGHGTHVTGTIVGNEPNGSNKIGVAPGAQWVAVKAFTSDGGSDDDLLAAAQWIMAPEDENGNTRVDLAPDIVNNSWGGGPGLDEWYRDVVVEWRNAQIFPVFAAGNVGSDNRGGPGSIVSPANYPESFAVGATDIGNIVGSFSLRGPSPYDEIKPDIVAPGQVIRSSVPENGYAANNGTSMASPVIAGVAALMKSVDTNITITEMEEILISTAIPLTDEEYTETPNNGYGHGLVDALNAVSSVGVGVGNITGKVLNEAGEPLQAEITILDQGRSVNTNSSDGVYSINYASGEYTVQVEAYGYDLIEQSVILTKNELTEVDFILTGTPKQLVTGKLTDKYTGDPIEGSTIVLWEDANITPVQTNEDGDFQFEAYEGEYTIQASARDYYNNRLEVNINDHLPTINIELKPFYTYYDEEIAYDNGTMSGSSRFHEGGNGWAVKMSLAEGEEQAMVTGGKFFFTRQIGNEFQVEVIDANGPNGSPGDRIAGPFDATVTAERDWTTVDLRDEGIIVTGDFYLVYHQTQDRADAPVLGHDQRGPYSWRSWEMYRGYWYELEPSILTGNKMIRALVDYEAEQPVITTPNDKTTDKNILLKGTALKSSEIEVLRNGERVETTETDNNGHFSIPIELAEGENKLEVVSLENGKKIGRSEAVFVTRESSNLVIENVTPETDQYVMSGDIVNVSFQSNIEGGQASFVVKLPSDLATQSDGSYKMEEVEPGLYEGTWTVPSNLKLNGASIEVTLTNRSGNTVSEEAVGRLYIYQDNIERISGKTRYDTAIKTSQTGWSQADTVVLARGDNYADSLAGVPLAYQLDAPILLTRPSTLYEDTMMEIKRLGATKAVVLGGTEAISDKVLTELENEGLQVERISGKTRYATAALIAERVAPEGATKAVVASGVDFPDALSIASHAAKEGLPILLTRANSMPEETDQAIDNLGVTDTLVIGGTVAISPEVVNSLPSAERLSGKTRYETNIEIAKHFDMQSKHMYVATGTDYADALTGAVLAAKNDSTILLVKNELPDVVSEFISEKEVKRLTVFGGAVAVDNSIISKLKKLLY